MRLYKAIGAALLAALLASPAKANITNFGASGTTSVICTAPLACAPTTGAAVFSWSGASINTNPTIGSMLFGDSTTSYTNLPAAAAGSALVSTGLLTAPAWDTKLRLGDGSLAAPTYSFASSPNSGMLFGSSILQFSVGGIAAASLVANTFYVGGNVSDLNFLNVNLNWPASHVIGITDATDGEWIRWGSTFQQASRGSNDATAYSFNCRKARQNVTSPTVITTGDALCINSGYGFVGPTNTYREAARIEYDSTGAIADSTTGIGGTIKLMTAKAGTDTAPQTNVTITGGSAGSVTIAAGTTLNPASVAGIVGTAAADNAQAGSVGEVQSCTLATGSSVSLTTNTTANICTINTLPAGDWDCTGVVDFTFGATTSYTNLVGGVTTTSATLGGQDTKFDYETAANVPTAGADAAWVLPVVRENIGSATQVWLVAQGTFTVSTLKAYGTLRCRRMR